MFHEVLALSRKERCLHFQDQGAVAIRAPVVTGVWSVCTKHYIFSHGHSCAAHCVLS